MNGLNLTTFFAYARKAPFGGRLTQSQIDGIGAIFHAWEMTGETSIKYLAYILATVFHETGGRMEPVREGFATTDAGARRAVRNRSYAAPDPITKHVYYGRGFVQITWADNYKRLGKIIAQPLYEQPDLALRPDISAAILVEGMLMGAFTGRKLRHFFDDDMDDAIGARAIINGKDKAALIAGYYKSFFDALNHAKGGAQPKDVNPEDAAPDAPNIVKDKTTVGALSAIAGSGAVGALASINSPWAFAAFFVLALGVFLFASGRVKLVKNFGA